MTQSKNHWYDGLFYDKLIAPNQDRLFGEIKGLINTGSHVIDIGCGTGRLAFTLAGICNSIAGIDLSEKNIAVAQQNLMKNPDKKIKFYHSDLSSLSVKNPKHYDFAVLTYVIHEVDESERTELLNEIMLVSDKLIIGDYIFPAQPGFSGWMSKTIEFIAGRDHYRNYKTYMANGGLHYLAQKAGLKIIYEKQFPSFNNNIVILTR